MAGERRAGGELIGIVIVFPGGRVAEKFQGTIRRKGVGKLESGGIGQRSIVRLGALCIDHGCRFVRDDGDFRQFRHVVVER